MKRVLNDVLGAMSTTTTNTGVLMKPQIRYLIAYQITSLLGITPIQVSQPLDIMLQQMPSLQEAEDLVRKYRNIAPQHTLEILAVSEVAPDKANVVFVPKAPQDEKYPEVECIDVENIDMGAFFGTETSCCFKTMILRDDWEKGLYRVKYIKSNFTQGNGWEYADASDLRTSIRQAIKHGDRVYQFDTLLELAQWAEG